MNTPGRALLLLAITSTAAFAATTVTQTIEPQQLGLDDVAQVTIEVTDANGAASVDLQPTADFEILGRSSSSSTRVEVGSTGHPAVQRSQRVSFSIRANQTGTLQIPAATVTVDGQRLQGEPQRLEVSPGHVARSRAPQQDPFASMFGADPFADSIFEDFFNRAQARPLDVQLIAAVDKRKVYKGDQATVSFYLATRSELTSVGAFKLPVVDGASAQDIDVGKALTPRAMTLDGKEYQAFLVARRALFPTRAGSLRIPAASVEVHGRTFKSSPRTIEVAAIAPGGEPGEPVGGWRVITTSNGKGQVGQPLPIQVAFEGTGDLQAIPEPRLDIIDARVLAPTVKDTASMNGGRVGGRRTYEFLVMPQKPGTLIVPPVKMAYFNVATGEHDVAQSESLTLDVSPVSPVATGANPTEVEPAPKADLQSAKVAPARVVFTVGAVALLMLVGFLTLQLARRVRRWARDRAPGRGALRRQASAELANARREAKGGRFTEAISLTELALFDCARAAGLRPEELDPDLLASDPARPFLSGWAQTLLECRKARFLRLEPEKVASILARAAQSLGEAPRSGPTSTLTGHRVSPTFTG